MRKIFIKLAIFCAFPLVAVGAAILLFFAGVMLWLSITFMTIEIENGDK